MDDEVKVKKRGRGRPRKENKLTASEHMRNTRRRQAEKGLSTIQIFLPVSLVQFIDEQAATLGKNRSEMINEFLEAAREQKSEPSND